MDARQRSVALTGSASRAGAPRRAWQILLGICSWVGFALLWLWQLEVYVPSTWLYSICLIASILAGWIVFTICWVRWNRNIYARRHRRTSPVRMEVAMDEDSLGRPIRAPGGIRAAEGQIVVDVDADGAKRYQRPRRARPSLPAALPEWPRAIPAVATMRARVEAAARANGHLPLYPNGNTNGNGNGHAPVHVNGNGNGHAPVHVNGNGNGNGNGHAPAYVNGNGNRHTHVNAHLTGNGNGHSPADANGNGLTNANGNGNGNGNGKGHPDPDAVRERVRQLGGRAR